MVVEDIQHERLQIVQAAIDAGFARVDVVEADCESAAFDAIANGLFQLAVVDLFLSVPDASSPEGLRVISHIRDKQPLCTIIAITKDVRNEIGVDALNAGAHDFVSKNWQAINWEMLLYHRLLLWKGQIEGLHQYAT